MRCQHERPDNDMHPAADTLPLKFLQRLGAAGNAGRGAATAHLG